jgi:hypothetical protein
MKLINRCFAIGMSALFAFTPVVPASAMPLAGSAQPVTSAAGSDVVKVQDNSPLWLQRKHMRNDARRYDRDRRWSSNRRSNSDRRWRNEERAGWYRGHRGYRYQRRGYRYHDGFWFPLAAFGAGALIGGAIANDRGYVGGGGSHTSWCANRYRSYRAYDNTFQPYNGPRQQCVSPYS